MTGSTLTTRYKEALEERCNVLNKVIWKLPVRFYQSIDELGGLLASEANDIPDYRDFGKYIIMWSVDNEKFEVRRADI